MAQLLKMDPIVSKHMIYLKIIILKQIFGKAKNTMIHYRFKYGRIDISISVMIANEEKKMNSFRPRCKNGIHVAELFHLLIYLLMYDYYNICSITR